MLNFFMRYTRNAADAAMANNVADYIAELTSDEGGINIVPCEPQIEFTLRQPYGIDCCGPWTNWKTLRFNGQTLEIALAAAVRALRVSAV